MQELRCVLSDPSEQCTAMRSHKESHWAPAKERVTWAYARSRKITMHVQQALLLCTCEPRMAFTFTLTGVLETTRFLETI